MPSDETITALLALPEGAREALKGCEGPGWGFAIKGPPAFLHARPLPDAVAWLPCNPLEIVRVAADGNPHSLGWDACQRDGEWFIAEVDCLRWVEEAETQHLAALALLAEVWK